VVIRIMGSITGTVSVITERNPPIMLPTKKAIYSGLAALGVVVGAASLSAAASPTPAPPADVVVAPTDSKTAQVDTSAAESSTEAADGPDNEVNDGPDNEVNDGPDDESDGQDESPSYTSSITADQAAEGVNEADENAVLAPLATVTTDEATAAATASQAGTVVSTQLENENGNVVYSVVIDTGNGIVDVKVDAGNGAVLASDSGDEGEGGESEADEASEVPEANDAADATSPAGG
jgi:uncharacterized membrane protein YkoI